VFSQFLWLTACEEKPLGQSLKVVTLSNIPSAFEISATAKTQLMSEDNPLVRFRQEKGVDFIETDNLYILALFLREPTADKWQEIIEKGDTSPEEILDQGRAYALMKIEGTAAQDRIIALSTDAGEIGRYWEPDPPENFVICTMLLTPDARFILRVDFSWKAYQSSMSEYTLDYNSVFDLSTVFSVVKTTPAKNPDKIAWEFLSDNFLEYIIDKSS
jgi:hypothetical protein